MAGEKAFQTLLYTMEMYVQYMLDLQVERRLKKGETFCAPQIFDALPNAYKF